MLSNAVVIGQLIKVIFFLRCQVDIGTASCSELCQKVVNPDTTAILAPQLVRKGVSGIASFQKSGQNRYPQNTICPTSRKIRINQ